MTTTHTTPRVTSFAPQFLVDDLARSIAFYQRLGFRMRSVERDAFNEATGYAPGIVIDGIELRDRVWLDRPVGAQARRRGCAGRAGRSRSCSAS